MKCLDLTFATPDGNLACDEALLDLAEEQGGPAVLRFWESPVHFVVLGYGNKVVEEVNVEACRELGIPILRRCSGGGTVLQGPGCLNYSVVMPVTATGPQQSIAEANTFVMSRNRRALEALLGEAVAVEGFTDLAVGRLKFSGNAQRRKREWFLFHGTFLLDFELSLIGRLLLPPPRQPDYRRQRAHAEFLTRLECSREALKRTLREAWNVTSVLPSRDQELQSRIDQLVAEKYSREDWNWSR